MVHTAAVPPGGVGIVELRTKQQVSLVGRHVLERDQHDWAPQRAGVLRLTGERQVAPSGKALGRRNPIRRGSTDQVDSGFALQRIWIGFSQST